MTIILKENIKNLLGEIACNSTSSLFLPSLQEAVVPPDEFLARIIPPPPLTALPLLPLGQLAKHPKTTHY